MKPKITNMKQARELVKGRIAALFDDPVLLAKVRDYLVDRPDVEIVGDVDDPGGRVSVQCIALAQEIDRRLPPQYQRVKS